MQTPYNDASWQPPIYSWLNFLKRHLMIVLFLVLAVSGMSFVYWYFSPPEEAMSVDAFAMTNVEGGLWAPIVKNVPGKAVAQRLPQSPGPIRVAIISGHTGFDSGAVCDDGLTEEMINSEIAQQVYGRLQELGIKTEVLDEFDPRLQGYSGTALISIHADSCQYINELATGFKVSGSPYTDSAALSICVEDAYANSTQLPYHANTITPDMADYHAFREVAPGMQAIIIEIGFMNLDRELLTNNQAPIVDGLVNGITCYLDTYKNQ